MFYYTNKRKRNKKIILIAGVVALAIALSVLIVVFSDNIAGWFSSSSEESDASTGTPTAGVSTPEPTPQKPLDETALTVASRFGVPDGFERVSVENGSFGEFLRNYSLKAYGMVPKYYDGSDYLDVQTSGVLGQTLISRMQNSPKAIMYLYAQYLYAQGAYDRISFNFYAGHTYTYSNYLKGQKYDSAQGGLYIPEDAVVSEPTEQNLRSYMIQVFIYANSQSLKTQLAASNFQNIQVGDVLIEHGHAILVMDVCRNKTTGEVRFICAEANSLTLEDEETGVKTTVVSDMYLLQDPETQSVWLTLEDDGTFVQGDKVYGADCVRRFN